MAREDRPLLGIAFCVGGLFVFSTQDAVVKLLSGDYGVTQIVFVRALVVGALVVGSLAMARRLPSLRTERLGLHLARGALATTSYTTYYLAVAAMPLAEVAAVYAAAPLFLTALSVSMLGERVGARRWTAVAIGFGGVLVMLRPGVDVFQPAAVFAVLAAFSYAAMSALARRLADTEQAATMTFYTNLVYLAATGSAGLLVNIVGFSATGYPSVDFLLRGWSWAVPMDVALMVLTGCIATAGFMLLARAYMTAPLSVVAPFEYSYLLFATAIGYVFWDELPRQSTVIGAVIVVSCGIYIAEREASLMRGRAVAGRRAQPDASVE